MFPRHSALALIFIFPSLSFAVDNFGKVELSLSQWQETMGRLEKAEAANNIEPIHPPVAPFDAIISNANCEIAWQKSQIRLTTDYEIELLNAGWITVPLADASFPLVSSQVSAGRIVVKDRAYVLITNQPGKIKVRLVQERSQTAEAQEFWVAPATTLQAKITTGDPDLHYTLNDLPLSGEPLAMTTSDAQKTTLHLQRSLALAAPKVELAPGTWQSRSETNVNYEDGRLNYRSRVVVLCTSGNDQEARLTLPANGIVLSVESENLDRWEVTPETNDDAEPTNLKLLWKKPGVRQRVVQVQVALAQPNLVGAWWLISPQSPGQDAPDEIWQLTTPPGLRPTLPSERPLAASLSSWMREQLEKNDSAVFQSRSGSQIEVSILKTVALAEARIETARFSSELAAGGGMLTEARLEIAASEKTAVDFQFEKDTRIISCRVAGQKQNPIDLGEGRIQLDIPSSGSERTLVELTYSQQLPAFDPASGQVRLTMPRTSLLTKAGGWSITLPAGLSLSAFDGSVTADSIGSKGELRFHQELYRDSSPLVVLFYQKKIK